MNRRWIMGCAVIVLVMSCKQCKPDPIPYDPNPYRDPPRDCIDAACSDGNVCTGDERCALETDSCIPVAPRCAGKCELSSGTCLECDANSDLDGDGSNDVACGGDDCNDWDRHIFPGAGGEECAAGTPSRSIDEDCDPDTFGDLDADGDGHVMDECCNRDTSNGDVHCGDDCADTDSARHPGAAEVCNRADDDCDRVIDEGIAASQTFYADCDGDGLGRNDWLSVNLCLNADQPPAAPNGCTNAMTAGWSTNSNDCNDSNGDIQARNCQPGATRPCMGACSGLGSANRRSINEYVNTCDRTYCEWDDECHPAAGYMSLNASELQLFGAQPCQANSACGCSHSEHACAEAGGDRKLARLAVGLPAGRYSIGATGTVQAGQVATLELKIGESSMAFATASASGFYNFSGEVVSIDTCPVFDIYLMRSDANVAVSVGNIVVLRLP